MTNESKRQHKEAERKGNEKPISLAPLTFDEALGSLLATDANAVREREHKAAKKRAAKKKR